LNRYVLRGGTLDAVDNVEVVVGSDDVVPGSVHRVGSLDVVFRGSYGIVVGGFDLVLCGTCGIALFLVVVDCVTVTLGHPGRS